mgnify:CR=1 FL=1
MLNNKLLWTWFGVDSFLALSSTKIIVDLILLEDWSNQLYYALYCHQVFGEMSGMDLCKDSVQH